MNYILKDAKLLNEIPKSIPAINIGDIITPAVLDENELEITPAVLATELEAVPEKFIFKATIFIAIEGAKEGEFIQDKNVEFILETTEQVAVRTELINKATELINQYNQI